jgi:modulator of FtsH protease
VSVAYDPAQWTNLFVATAGASAALAGLLFVAVSINVDRIIHYRGLPERGVETLALLLVSLIVSIAGLMPGQGHVALGVELTAIAAALLAALFSMPVTHELPEGAARPPAWLLSRWLIRLTGPGLLLLGALSELFAFGGGLYWIAAAIVFATLGAVANAWVLLVEILR